jgi:hypothetical protein
MPLPILLLVALSALVGWLGRDRAIGFAGFFVLSLIFTPFITSLVLLVSMPRSTAARRIEGPEADS